MREIGGCTINTEQCTYNVCSMQGGEGDGGGQKKSTMKDGEGKRKLESVYPPSEEEEERKRVWKGGERKCVDCVIAAKRRSFPPSPTPNPIAYLSRQTILSPPIQPRTASFCFREEFARPGGRKHSLAAESCIPASKLSFIFGEE